jgi:hypothetical protein
MFRTLITGEEVERTELLNEKKMHTVPLSEFRVSISSDIKGKSEGAGPDTLPFCDP